MTFENACKVIWHSRFNNKLMGDLFESGYLTADLLRQTIKASDDEEMQEACKVFLDLRRKESQERISKNAVPTNYEEALNVFCPYTSFLKSKGINRPITYGELWDKKIISLADLGYQIAFNASEQSTQASIILLAYHQSIYGKKLASSYGALKVTSNLSFMESERERISLKKGLWLGAALALIFFVLLLLISYMIYTGTISTLINSHGLILAMVFIFAIAFFSISTFILNHTLLKWFDKKIDSYDTRIKSHRKGQEGEDRVLSVMRENLDGRCYSFCNLVLPHTKNGDIDNVLVTPNGIFAFEVKNISGHYYVNKDFWRMENSAKSVKRQPSLQSIRNAQCLANFLSADFTVNNSKKWVKPVVILANSEVKCSVVNSEVEIWKIEDLPSKLEGLSLGQNISPKLITDISNHLKKLYK